MHTIFIELPRNICLHPPRDGGECPGKFPRYSFDPADNTCKDFVYGGCGGNGNNFASFGDCEAKCKYNTAVESMHLDVAVVVLISVESFQAI